jgi:hypothetical protein
MFDAFFVKCDTQKTMSFFTDDLEFYHDITGLKITRVLSFDHRSQSP